MITNLGTGFWILIGIIALWDVVWKGFALWYSARNKHKVWFVFILILNTIGILPIIYILTHKRK
ncbi:MAG TPA: DUF5652 family protein [Bacillota bacterium]|nr:DUF5652 family protein [Bacillota bacterium]